jgi:hypothetical protein
LELAGVGNPQKVLALVLRNRGNGDLKCSAKDDVCRMLNPGETVSGRFEVSEGLITVTQPDGRKTTADIEESMLSPEILAKVLLLQMHRARQPNATSEDLLED